MNYKLTFLYDGECPLCLRETNFLIKKDTLKKIKFIDISEREYNPKNFKNITYSVAMKNLHGILDNGKIIKGLDVLSYSYELIGLGWIYYPAKIPYISNFLKLIYRFWAQYRLKITGRPNLEKICSSNCLNIK